MKNLTFSVILAVLCISQYGQDITLDLKEY